MVEVARYEFSVDYQLIKEITNGEAEQRSNPWRNELKLFNENFHESPWQIPEFTNSSKFKTEDYFNEFNRQFPPFNDDYAPPEYGKHLENGKFKFGGGEVPEFVSWFFAAGGEAFGGFFLEDAANGAAKRVAFQFK